MLARRFAIARAARRAAGAAAGPGPGGAALCLWGAAAKGRARAGGRGVRYRLYMVSRIESIGCLGLRGTALVDSGAPSRSIV